MSANLIKNIAEALKVRVTISEIHDVLAKQNMSEEDIFLLIKAGEIFLKHSNEIDKRLVLQNLPFGRIRK